MERREALISRLVQIGREQEAEIDPAGALFVIHLFKGVSKGEMTFYSDVVVWHGHPVNARVPARAVVEATRAEQVSTPRQEGVACDTPLVKLGGDRVDRAVLELGRRKEVR